MRHLLIVPAVGGSDREWPPGLGTHVHWDRRLDSRLAAAMLGIQAIKGVEFGDGFANARSRGSKAPDEIEPGDDPRDFPEAPGGKRLSILDWGTYARYMERPLLRTLFLQFFCFMLSFSTFTSGFALFAERTFTWKGHPFGPREIGLLDEAGDLVDGIAIGRLDGDLLAALSTWSGWKSGRRPR